MSLILFFFIYSPVLFNLVFFFFNDTATTEIYTLSLHDALPICIVGLRRGQIEEPVWFLAETVVVAVLRDADYGEPLAPADLKPLADRVLARPVTVCELLTHNGDELRIVCIAPGKCPASDKRNL